mgnify:CR=1 FL=1
MKVKFIQDKFVISIIESEHLPVSGSFSFDAVLSRNAPCETWATYQLTALMPSELELQLNDPNDALANVVTGTCPQAAVFSGVTLTTSTAPGNVFGDATLTISWAGFSNDYGYILESVFVVTGAGAKFFTKLDISPTELAADLTASVAHNSSGDLTVTFSGNGAVPPSGSFVIAAIVDTSVPCNSVVTLTLDSASPSLVSVVNGATGSPLSATFEAEPCPAIFYGVSMSATASGDLAFNWTNYLNLGALPITNFTFMVDTLPNVIDEVSLPLELNAVAGSITWTSNTTFVVHIITPAADIPGTGSFIFKVAYSAWALQCAVPAPEWLYVAVGAPMTTSPAPTLKTTLSICDGRTAPELGGVTIKSVANQSNPLETIAFNISWSQFTPSGDASLGLVFELGVDAAGQDYFDGVASLTGNFDTASSGTTVLYEAGVFKVFFTAKTLPDTGFILLSPRFVAPTPCSVSAEVELAPYTAVIISSASTPLTATVLFATCLVTFTDLVISVQAPQYTANERVQLAWSDFTNTANVTGVPLLAVTTNAASSNFPTPEPQSVLVIDDNTGLSVPGATAMLTFDAATDVLSIAFSGPTPSHGSIFFAPVLSVDAACGASTLLTVSVPNALVSAITGNNSTLGAEYVIGSCSQLTGLEVAYSNGNDEYAFKLSWSTFTAGTAHSAEVLILLTGNNSAAIFVPGDLANITVASAADGEPVSDVVVTATLSSTNLVTISVAGLLPTEGSIVLPLELTTSPAHVCNASVTYSLSAADTNTVTVTLSSESTTVTANPVQCLYNWVCNSSSGAACSDNAPNQYSACSTTCGNGTQHNSPECGEWVMGEYFGTTTTTSFCYQAEPSSTLACTDWTCPQAFWACNTPNTPIAYLEPCSNDDGQFGFECPASDIGCKEGSAPMREVLCLSNPVNPTVLTTNCPVARIGPAPANQSSTTCPPQVGMCEVDFTAGCYSDDDNTPVYCAAAGEPVPERLGRCVGPDGLPRSISLCQDAGLSLTKSCSTLPPCGTAVSWQHTSTSGCLQNSKNNSCLSFIEYGFKCGYIANNNTTVEVPEYLCADKLTPTPYVPCDTAIVCQAGHGSCTNFEPRVVGEYIFTNISASCTCLPGFGGDGCEVAATVANATMGPIPNAEFEGALVKWTSNLPNRIAVVVYDTRALTLPITVGYVNANIQEYSLNAFLSDLLPGTYVAELWVHKSFIVSVSGWFTVTPDRCNNLCSLRGVCDPLANDGSGGCKCLNGFSGSLCTESPCLTIDCYLPNVNLSNPKAQFTNSVCYLDALEQASCLCDYNAIGESLFKDKRCIEPLAGCPGVTCYNGGIPGSSVVNGIATCSGSCVCPSNSNYNGTQCNDCAIQCNSAGTAHSSGCGSCACRGGFAGPLCNCRYATLKLLFPSATAPWFYNNSTSSSTLAQQIRSFERSLMREVRHAMSYLSDALSLSVASLSAVNSTVGNANINVVINVGPYCQETDDANSSGDFNSLSVQEAVTDSLSRHSPLTTLSLVAAPTVGVRVTALPAADKSMNTTYAALSTFLTAVTTGAAVGPLLQYVNASNIGISDAGCSATNQCANVPQGTGTGTVVEPESSSSRLSEGAKIGLGVGLGVGGALVIVLIVLLCWRFGVACFGGDKLTDAPTTCPATVPTQVANVGNAVATNDDGAAADETKPVAADNVTDRPEIEMAALTV